MMRRGAGLRPAVLLLILAACPSTATRSTVPPSPSSTTTTTTSPSSVPLRIALEVERRTEDRETENFVAVVRETLEDARGWRGAGFAFVFSDDAPYLETYRRMLVNHEVGHLLGQHHPATHCPQPGKPAPVMTQQSTELDGCLPNPWPLPWELDCAARHHDPIAPGYEDHPASVCEGS